MSQLSDRSSERIARQFERREDFKTRSGDVPIPVADQLASGDVDSARILLLGDDRAETDVLALAMESFGRPCAMTDSLKKTIRLLQTESFDLVVLGRLNGCRLENVVKSLQNACSKPLVMVITENSRAAQEAEQLLAVPCSFRKLLWWLHHVPGNHGTAEKGFGRKTLRTTVYQKVPAKETKV